MADAIHHITFVFPFGTILQATVFCELISGQDKYSNSFLTAKDLKQQNMWLFPELSIETCNKLKATVDKFYQVHWISL